MHETDNRIVYNYIIKIWDYIYIDSYAYGCMYIRRPWPGYPETKSETDHEGGAAARGKP